MRVSFTWLQQYVDIPWTLDELADRLTMAGLMVEKTEPLAPNLDGVVAAEIVAAEPHPRGDRLKVATVTDGVSRRVVVTGAPNAAAGTKVAYAPPGVALPGGDRIEARDVRGVRSEGMLCSEAELGVGEDGSQLWVLPPDATPGRPVAAELGLDDVVLHLEVYPNRPDSLSVIGVAREVAAMTGQRVRLPDLGLSEEAARAAEATSVHIEDGDLCRRYSARIVDDVRVGPSPGWLQQRLRVAGMRTVNNVVDVTNFVMWEWGQPLHAFDADRLEGGGVAVRRARAGEKLVTLDGQERPLAPDMLVIADAKGPVAIAGVMGGADSEVTEATRRVLLEAASFDPVSVRRTAQRFGLRTEASHRFEKGLDPNLAEAASRRAAKLLQRTAGGRVLAGAVDVYPEPAAPKTVDFRPRRARALLGVDVSDDDAAARLEALELQVERRPETWRVTVPTFRTDLRHEADLIEEVARLYGYDNVPARLPGGAFAVAHQSSPLPALDAVREHLVGAGLYEALTYSFIDPRDADKLGWDSDDPRRKAIELRNPLKEDMQVMRTSLLPGLLHSAARNRARRNLSVHLFEIGAVFVPESLPLASLPTEARRVGLLMTGPLPERHWGRRPAVAGFFHMKGVVEGLCAALGVEPTFRVGQDASLHPGRRAEVVAGDRAFGFFGEVHPDVAARWDLDGERVYVAELDADRLAAAYEGRSVQFARLPRYPAVQRDVALVAPREVTAAVLEHTLREAGGDLLEDLRLFDVYEGERVEAGYRSLAYALTLRAPDRTLTEGDAEDVLRKIDAALARRGVRRRV